MNETVNLHLPQFEATDRIHHDDFNDAFAAIDAACGGFVTGRYTGDGTAAQQITLGFRPKVVLLFPNMQNQEMRFSQIALAFDGYPHNDVTINDTGFTVEGNCNNAEGTSNNNLWCNPYRYMAWH